MTAGPLPVLALPQTPEALPWSIEDSEELYRIRGWGEPYFSINAAGHVTVSPMGERGGSLDLFELVQALQQRGLSLPLLIRFSDILQDRIERLHACFARAIARYNYPGVYRGVFPVKCNQQRHLVEDLVRFGEPHHFGLECGSKPELLIALATLKPSDDPDPPLLICNGYKDREYIETAILSRRLGHNTVIVIEQVEEAEVILEVSRELGIRPAVGVRAKLSTKGVGRWGTSAGDRAKFGLTVPEMLGVVETLRAGEALECLRLLHFHIGSQISSISVIKEALREAGHIYAELKALGAAMGYLDVGGGLAVDYDGSKTNFYASKNYSMQNYTNDVVAAVKDICTVRGIPVPTIVSESGRAIAAHQSVLVFNVLGVGERQVPTPQRPDEDAPLVLRNLYETWESLSPDNYQEIYHDAQQFKDEAISLFNLGYLTLAQRGAVEQLYWACCQRLLEITQGREYVPDDLEDLPKSLAALYYVNLSVFQSVPDNWAIDQLFPIMPLHRLGEEPAGRATLADLTCDSDGKIDQFIDLKDVKPFLELHRLNPGEPYYLGLFLGGAYQEIMGNLHNLFGDTNTVHIRLTPGAYRIEHVVRGDTMREVLGYVQYDPEDLLENMRRQTEQALQDKHITLPEAQKLLQNYEDSLNRYTYLTG